jgi:hypothetical protein
MFTGGPSRRGRDARILAEEIGARVPTERVVMFPWRGVMARILQYQVVVAVQRFDGRPGGDVTLDTRWRILGRAGDELTFRRSTVVEPTGSPGYQPMVAAMTAPSPLLVRRDRHRDPGDAALRATADSAPLGMPEQAAPARLNRLPERW